MSIELLALAGLLWAFIFVPAAYFISLRMSNRPDSVARSPCVDEIYNFLDGLRSDVDALRNGVGRWPEQMQLMESKLRLMSTEMEDFFEKALKSEQRARGHARRAEASVGEEEDTEAMDQQMLALMQGQQEGADVAEQNAPMTREEYYQHEGQ